MLFSIITVTYNAAGVLAPTLESVQEQSFRDFEYLVIDGASTDDTLRLVDDAQIPTAKVWSEPDKGLYDAMNKAIDRAQGKYLIFLNAGDAFATAETLALIARCAEDDPDVIYGQTQLVDSARNVVGMRHLTAPATLDWRSFKNGMLVCHQAFYVRTDIAKQYPYDLQYRHSADVDWCIRVMREADHQGLALVNTHAILANFEEGGDTTQHHRDSLKERFKIMMHHYGLVQTVVMHAWFVVRSLLRAGTQA